MKVHTYRSADELAEAVARDIAEAIADKPDLVLGLPAGRTPIRIYREIAALSRIRSLDWSRVRTFNLDEFVAPPGPLSHPFRQFMHEHLLSLVNLAPAHMDSPDGNVTDLDAECRRYDRSIEDTGGLDLLLLGIGANGHIGFNEPAPELVARTHVTALSDASRAANAWLFGDDLDRVPTRALTMGIATLLGARRVILVATGASKAAAVSAMVTGGVTAALPASLLQLHADVTVVLDEPAAAHLAG